MNIGMNLRTANLPVVDGNSAVLRSAARAMAARPRGHRLFFYVDSKPRLPVVETDGVRIKVLHPFPAFNRLLTRAGAGDPWYRLRLPLASSWRSLDAFICSAHEPGPMFGRPRRVVIVNDLAFLLPDAPRFFPRLLLDHLDLWTGANVHAASAIVAISQTTAADICRLYGVPSDRVVVLRIAHDPADFHAGIRRADIDVVLDKLNLHRPYILHVGTRQPRKNIPRIVEAVEALRSRDKLQHKLVLAGTAGWTAGDASDAAQTANEFVLDAGAPSTPDIARLMAGAEALVMAGFYEGFGLPALEAMACGTPVVAAQAGALPEVVGAAGALFDPNDANDLARVLGGVLANESRREEMRRRGLRRAAEFTWEAHADGMLDLIEGLA